MKTLNSDALIGAKIINTSQFKNRITDLVIELADGSQLMIEPDYTGLIFTEDSGKGEQCDFESKEAA